MDLKTARQIFMTAKKAQMVTATTFRLYNDQLRRFLSFAMDRDIFDTDALTKELIEAYLIDFKSSGVRNITVHRDFRIIRTFSRFLYQNDFTNSNPIEGVTPPIKEKKVMRTFTAQEIKKMCNSFDKSDYYGYRNYAITATFFSTGIRKTELSNIKMTDINFTGEFIRIFGKGQKERLVPIGRTLERIIKHYLELRDEHLTQPCNYLFISKKGGQLTSIGLQRLFQHIKKELQIPGERVSCHTWRHTFAKNYLLNGEDIFSLQKIMGHADIATTKQYLNLNENEVKAQHAKFNPLDNTDWLI